MKFSEDHAYEVVLHHRELGKLGEATLTFGGEKPVVAEMRRMSPGTGLGTGRALDFVRADTQDGRSFTLCQCTVHGFVIYATYLAYGDITENRISRIDVRYSDISEWFLNRQRIQGNVGENLNWSEPAEHFSIEVADGNLKFNLSSRYVGTRKKIGEDHVLNEHVKFCFGSPKGEFELETVRGRVIELGFLLSLLISYPISVVSVEVWTGQDRIHSVYFGSFKEIERDTTRNFSQQCFIQKHALDGRWAMILQIFYEDPDRRKFWCRLAGMLRYEGFWEFKFLGYVSLLDKYVNGRARTLSPVIEPPGRKKLIALRAGLNQISPKLDAQVMIDIEGIAKRVFVRRRSTFADKYLHSIANTTSDVVKIIDITDKDFRLIKRVRDNIAHGKHPGLAEEEFTRAEAVVRKISLLLTYWSLLDLGLRDEDFLEALNTTQSRLRFGAPLNEKHLDRVTKRATFFSVSAEKFRVLSSRKDIRVFACFLEGPPGEIELADHYIEIWRRWNTNPSRSATIAWEDLFEVPRETVRHAGSVYIECGFDSLHLSAVCIFDRSKLPA